MSSLKLLSIHFGTTEKTQAARAKESIELSKKYIAEMKDVIRYDYGPFIVAALASGGKMSESLAGLYSRIQPPSNYNKEESAQYKALIQKQIDGLKNDAKASYKAAIEKSQELEAYTPWTRIAEQNLAALEGRGDEAGEIVADSKAADWMGL